MDKKENARLLLEENRKLKSQKEELLQQLQKNVEKHRKWEEIAVQFHDTLWKVLLKYEPDTYGVLYPNRKTDEIIDIASLPQIHLQEENGGR